MKTRLDLSGCDREVVNSLPDGMTVRGSIFFGTQAARIPNDASISEDLHISSPNLEKFPESLVIHGSLSANGCVNLRNIPVGVYVCGHSLDLSDCKNLKEISESIYDMIDFFGHALFSVRLHGCMSLTSLPYMGYTILREFDISGCKMLTTFPSTRRIHGDLDMSDCVKLEALPNVFTTGDLHAENCTSLKYVGEIEIRGSAYFYDCSAIEWVSEEAKVNGMIYSRGSSLMLDENGKNNVVPHALLGRIWN